MDKLDKLEKIVTRANVDYKQAVEALREAEGDLEAAVKSLKRSSNSRDEIKVKGEELKQKIEELIRESSVTRLKVKQGTRTLLDIPAAAGVLGTVISPYLAAVSGLAAILTKCSIEIERGAEEAGTGIIDNQGNI